MRKTPLEIANPQEWLASLAADAEGFRRLVRESGGVGRAAYRLARARCSVLFDAAPELADLQAAAGLLGARLGGHSVLPISSLLPPPPEAAARTPSSFPAGPTVQETHSAAPPRASSLPPPAPSSLSRVKPRPQATRASV
ncbi:MAG: hypothetical protein ABJB12_06215 [Pseudomonadota bacterium]